MSPDCGSAIYINFTTKSIYTIVDHWPNVGTKWLSETVAHVAGPCGTGCAQSIIFVAPATVVSCATHEYRIKNLSENLPPDFYNNTPLLIDPKRGIYVCYDDTNKIQVFPLPTHPSIQPPKGYFSDSAYIHNNRLVIIYEDAHGKTKTRYHPL